MTSLFTDNRSSRLLVVESVVDHSLVHSTLQNRQFSRTEREARYMIAERKTSLSFSSLLLSRALRSGIVFRSREYPSDNFEGFSLRPKQSLFLVHLKIRRLQISGFSSCLRLSSGPRKLVKETAYVAGNKASWAHRIMLCLGRKPNVD